MGRLELIQLDVNCHTEAGHIGDHGRPAELLLLDVEDRELDCPWNFVQPTLALSIGLAARLDSERSPRSHWPLRGGLTIFANIWRDISTDCYRRGRGGNCRSCPNLTLHLPSYDDIPIVLWDADSTIANIYPNRNSQNSVRTYIYSRADSGRG